MKKIDVTLTKDGALTVNLGGELDNSCCGNEARRLNQLLEEFGVRLQLEGIHCRLPIPGRVTAKINGECNSQLSEVQRVYFSDQTARLRRREAAR